MKRGKEIQMYLDNYFPLHPSAEFDVLSFTEYRPFIKYSSFHVKPRAALILLC